MAISEKITLFLFAKDPSEAKQMRRKLLAYGWEIRDAASIEELSPDSTDANCVALVLLGKGPDQDPFSLSDLPERRIPVVFAGLDSEGDVKRLGEVKGEDFEYVRFGDNLDELYGRITLSGRLAALERKAFKIRAKDSLTGLPNRFLIFGRLREEAARSIRHKKDVSVAVIGIDELRSINDKHGLSAGDLVLRSFAELLNKRCRSSDQIGRLADDEFVSILPETTVDKAVFYTERVVNASKVDVVKAGKFTLNYSVSAGISGYSPDDQYDVDKVILRAQDALFEARSKGAGRISLGV